MRTVETTWEDLHLDTIKSILGRVFFVKDTAEDLKHATDLLMYFKSGSVSVGIRLRANYHLKYRHQFTVRYSQPSGAKTELAKIMEGHCDFMFYGFLSRDEQHICQYRIIDWEIFRRFYHEPVLIDRNDYSGSEFAVYNVSDFPPELVVCQYPGRNDAWTEQI